MVLELRGIRKSYGAETVLNGFSLGIEEGSFTVLLGPSCCGKSTILRVIAGLEPCQEGNAFIDGGLPIGQASHFF